MPNILLSRPARLALLALFFAAAFTACTPRSKQPQLEPLEKFGIGGPRLTMKELLRTNLKEQHLPLESIYSPPEQGFTDSFHLQVAMEHAVLNLATDVVRYAADAHGLAAAFTDGSIQVISDWPCPSLLMPGATPAEYLSWSSESPYLLATDKDKASIRVFDLRQCAEVKELAVEGRAAHMAVSRSGQWLAVADEVYDLWLGPANGPLAKISRLRFITLDLDFTPGGKMLNVIDQIGWVTVWMPESGELAGRYLVPGGPFQEAELDGRTLRLTTVKGENLCWDLASRAFVKEPEGDFGFFLKQGVLSYRTLKFYPVKKMRFGPALFKVHGSARAGLVRVTDPDHVMRYYDAKDGTPVLSPDQDQRDAGDWKALRPDQDYGFKSGKKSFVLADRIFQSGTLALYARDAGADGFFLWWRETGQPEEFDPHHGKLPARPSLLADTRPLWRAPDLTSMEEPQ